MVMLTKKEPAKRAKRPNKNVHTSPKNAGAHNLEGRKLPEDKKGIMQYLLPVYKKGKENNVAYKGLWTDEQLAESVDEFFEFCKEHNAKPNNPLLTSWLGVSKTQYYDWVNKPQKYGAKSNIIKNAREIMESYLMENVDSYPTGSIFLLKAYHGVRDSQVIEISADKGKLQGADEIAESLKRLGLN